MVEPVTEMVLEAPGGLIRVRANYRHEKARSITVQNVPSFVGELALKLTAPGFGNTLVNNAYGADSFVVVVVVVVVDAARLGLNLDTSCADRLAKLGVQITNAVNE